MKAWKPASLAVLAMAGQAAAGVTDADLRRVMASRNITPITSERADANLSAIVGLMPTGVPVAVTSLDFDGNGTAEMVLLMTMVPTGQDVPLSVLNGFNDDAASKGFSRDGQVGIVFPVVAAGAVDDATIGFGMDLFAAEMDRFLDELGPYRGNAVNVSLGLADPKSLDHGLTRAEIAERDARFTAHLNAETRPAEGASGYRMLLDAAFERAGEVSGRR